MYKDNINDNIEKTVNEYLDCLIEEVRSYRNKSDVEKAKKEGQKNYKKFLGEFYKTSYGSYLGNSKSEKSFEYVLSLHHFIQKIRKADADKVLTPDKYLQIEMFLRDIKNNKDIDLKTFDLPVNTAKVILRNRNNLLSEEKEEQSKEKYLKNHKFSYYLKKSLSLNTLRMRHAIQFAITFTIGIFIFRKFEMIQSVWLPTAMVVIAQPYGQDSKKKIWNRILGTIFGLILVHIIVAIVHDPKWILIIAILSFYPTFCLMQISYSLVVTFATISAVLMSLSYISPEDSSIHRILYTIIAGAIVFIVEFLLKDRSRTTIKKRIIQIFENDVIFISEIIKLLKYGGGKKLDEYIMRGYIFREILVKDLENTNENKNNNIALKDSLLFMGKLEILYYQVKTKNIDKKNIEILILISDFIKSSIVFIKTENLEEILKYKKIIEKLLDNYVGDIIFIEILELIEHHIEHNIERLNN